MDTRTSYLGMRLEHPFIAGASPLGYHLDSVKRLEDAGCAAVVLHSLFEEQISRAYSWRVADINVFEKDFADILQAFPEPGGIPAESGCVCRARLPRQTGGWHTDHRIAQWPHGGIVASIRPRD